MTSLRVRLLVLWMLSLAASVAVGVILLRLYDQSSSAQSSRLEALLGQACDSIVDRYGYYVAGWSGPPDDAFKHDLVDVVSVAIEATPGLDAGIWQQGSGALTPAPTGAIATAVAQVATSAIQDDTTVSLSFASNNDSLLLRACPLGGPVPSLAAWTLARQDAAPGYGNLRVGLGVLMALVLSMAAWLSLLIVGFSRRVAAIEHALAGEPGAELPRLPPTGERDLDRIVVALNTAGARLAEARARADALAVRVAGAERLAALGRVAAGVAHEIRNPLAAMRLKAENALAGNDQRRSAALGAVLTQVARIDRLVSELLDMTGPREPVLAPTDLGDLLQAAVTDHQDIAGSRVLAVEAPAARLMLDAAILRRALDNLVQNAIRHSPPDGTITLRAHHSGDRLRIDVIDGGPGVPEVLRTTLFEPFVTGSADGTGLGLAIAREMAEAHGGTLALTHPGPNAVFTLEIPWEAAWQPS
jgi:signal transduction histidine kinase